MSFYMKIYGAKRIEKKLDKLEKKVAKKVVVQAVRKVAKDILKTEMESKAKSMVGGKMGKELARSISVVTAKRRHKGDYMVIAKTKPKKGQDGFIYMSKKGKRSYIPHAIEFGHGNVKPIPFMRTAWKKSVKMAQKALAKQIVLNIVKQA